MANLLLIVVDCLRADMLARGRGAWPRMSGLAAGGARFTDCYSTCPTTTPAVTAILTGRYPGAHGVRGLRGTQLSPAIPTAAEQLAQAGFATWCSATGPLLDTVGTFRGFAEADYRDVPRRSVHSPWGEESVGQLAQLAAGEPPFFALVHLWDAHTPRSYPAEFEDRGHGRNAYERAIAGMDAWIGDAVEAAGPDTVVVLTGDHGENIVFEPHNLREQAAWRRINQRLPIARWSQATVDHGVRSHSKRSAAVGAALLLEPRPDAARAAGAGAAGRVRPGRRRRRAANAGEPRRPGADPRRPGRWAAPGRRVAGREPGRVAARRR